MKFLRRLLGGEDPRDTVRRLYGDPVDVDKIWEDRDAFHDAYYGFAP